MANFIAKRIHDGYMSWDDLKGKKKTFITAVKKAYKALYPGEEVPG